MTVSGAANDDGRVNNQLVLDGMDDRFAKLLTLEGTMQTPAGRVEAGRRTQFIRQFLAQLHAEIGSPEPGQALPMASGGSAGKML